MRVRVALEPLLVRDHPITERALRVFPGVLEDVPVLREDALLGLVFALVRSRRDHRAALARHARPRRFPGVLKRVPRLGEHPFLRVVRVAPRGDHAPVLLDPVALPFPRVRPLMRGVKDGLVELIRGFVPVLDRALAPWIEPGGRLPGRRRIRSTPGRILRREHAAVRGRAVAVDVPAVLVRRRIVVPPNDRLPLPLPLASRERRRLLDLLDRRPEFVLLSRPPRPGERALAVLGLPRADGGVPLVEDAVRPPPRDEVHLHARVFRIVTRVALPPVQLGRRQRLLFVLRRVRQRGELLARLLDALRRRRPSLSLRRSRHGAAEPRVLQGRSIQAKVGVEFIGVSWR
eukprot:31439-Pelagococcus_subviridis.AAC.11